MWGKAYACNETTQFKSEHVILMSDQHEEERPTYPVYALQHVNE